MAAPQGEWEIIKDENEIPIDSLVTAIHAVLIPITEIENDHPVGKVLYWHGRYITNYDDGGKIVTCLYEPETNNIIQYTVPVWPDITDPYDPSKIFCSGHLTLADGRVLTSGGERNIPPLASRGLKYSFIFDQGELGITNRPWRNTRLQDSPFTPTIMNRGRWYPQLTRIQNGKVVAVSGYKYESQEVETRPEIFDPSNESWIIFPEDATQPVPLYNGAYLIPFGDWKGEILYDLVSFGPELPSWNRAHRFKPDLISPEWNYVGAENTIRYKGNSVLLPFRSTDSVIRVINLGGGNDSHQKTAELIEIGNSTSPVWISLEDMNYKRHDAPNALLLADGSLIVIGGGHDMQTVLTPEVLDYSDPNPSNWIWNVLPDMEVPRKYHSTALLLPDGSVWTAGSRIYTDPQKYEFENDMERRIEIFKPGYFFDGYRPEINEAPLTISYGTSNKFNVSIFIEEEPDILIDSFVLISLASVTHCYDSNQRYVILDFTNPSKGLYEVTPPIDAYVATPGYYMLFAIKDKSQSDSGELRLPSKSKIIKLVIS